MSEHSDDRDGGEGARKRVRQACLTCRKKKVRCSGEKPICSLCTRLAQTCRYEELPDPGACPPGLPTTLGSDHQLATEAITYKLESLQERLASVEATIQSIVPLLSSLAKQGASTSPSTIPTSTNRPFSPQQMQQIQQMPISKPVSNDGIPPLPPRHTLELAADLYFRFCYNQPYSLFHEATFRQRLASGDLPNYLIWAFLAAATRYTRLLDNEPVRHDDAASYTKAAWDCIELPWSPSATDKDIVSVLQTLILIVSTEHPAGLCSAAYMKLGFALRLALCARFNLEPDPSLPPVVKEERRRIFWALYLQDRLISLSRVNVPVIRDEQCRLRLPCFEPAFLKGIDEFTPELEDMKKDSVDESSINRCSALARCALLASTLSRVTQYILLEDRASKPIPPWSPSSPYAAAVSNLMQLESHFGMNEPIKAQLERTCFADGTVDQHLAGPLIYSRVLFHLCHSLLHHPFLLKQLIYRTQQKAPASFLSRAWETCRFHATCLSDLTTLRNQNLVLLTSLYAYSTMIAGTVHVLDMHDQKPSVRESAREHYKISVEFLRELAHFWKHAELMLARLERLHHRHTKHPHLLDPQEGHSGRSPAELDVLWQSVDYAMLSVPTRPGTPIVDDVNRTGQASTLQSSFIDFDFGTWTDAPDMIWDFQDANGNLTFSETFDA